MCEQIVAAKHTTFERLLAFASLRAKESDNYLHPELEQFPPGVVTSVLREQHEKFFIEWLSLSLEEQHKELAEFFSSMWSQGRPRLPVEVRHMLVPPSAGPAERMLFLSDLDWLLSALQAEEG